jgi:hypothetical protein
LHDKINMLISAIKIEICKKVESLKITESLSSIESSEIKIMEKLYEIREYLQK